ncbi:MAG: hypothetical protein HQ530_02885 [Parcubacteria group bacterium]|nr:hypothetical protein [Parcubacteria group bacterium]
MDQPTPDQKPRASFRLDKKISKPIIVLILVAGIVAIGLVSYLVYQCSFAPTDESSVVVEPTKSVYFGLGRDDGYSFVNVANDEKKDIIPAGYEIVNQYSYDSFPSYIILKKDNSLFTYSLDDQAINKISLEPLKDSEKVWLDPSISEPGKFYLEINDTEEELGMFGYKIVSTRKYFLNADNNQLEVADNIKLPGVGDFFGCHKYDSKYDRFFVWPCGEGVGSSIPLSLVKIDDLQEQQIVTFSEFGMSADNTGMVDLEYDGRYFLATPKGEADQIIVVDPHQPEPKKEVYTITEEVQNEIADKSRPYSTAISEKNSTIVIGGGDYITLLRFDQDKQIIASKIIPEDKLYANFIFVHDGKLYYQAKESKAIRVVDLKSWEVEKSIPVEPDEEITLFSVTD